MDGQSLTIEDLIKIGQGEYRVKVNLAGNVCVVAHSVPHCNIQLSESAKEAVKKSRAIVDDIVQSHKGKQVLRAVSMQG